MSEVSQRYKKYLLTVLLVILAFNFVDRLALGLVLEEIKTDLSVNDTQLGFLSGIAFALFYSVMGIPIARWADRGNRVTIISLSAALWSVAVAFCGVAGSFTQMLLIRVGVGVGEAGCMPPAQSLIADHFTRAERPRAAAIYALGAPLSMVVGYFLAGWLNELYGWRVMFLLLGLPGLALAALAWLTVKEPRQQTIDALTMRVRSDDASSSVKLDLTLSAQPSFRTVCATLWANRTFRHLVVGFSVLNFFIYGVLQWQPTFFIRSYGLQTGELGTWFAVIYGVVGVLGTYVGGEWASHHSHNERLHLRVVAFLYCGLGVMSPFVYLSHSSYLALGLLAVFSFGYFSTFGPAVAAIQTIVPARMRATAFALLYFFVNLIGMGLGPLAVGSLSDAMRPWAGQDSLRYALLSLCPGYFWVAWHIWRASTTVTDTLDDMQALSTVSSGGSSSPKY